MIKVLNNVSKKSFSNYTYPSETKDKKFGERNFFFGYNGKGKSSLAQILKEEFLKTNDINELRYFDKDYVENNILVDKGNPSLMKGVKLSFGEKNVEIDKQIDEIKKDLKDKSSVEKEIENINKSIETEIRNIIKDNKGAKNVKYKDFNSWNNDIEKAKGIMSEEELLSYTSNINFETIIENIINKLSISTLSFLEFEKENDLIRIMNNKYEDSPILSQETIKWIEDGLKLHNHNDKYCKFCGSPLNLESILEEKKKRDENTKQKDLMSLSSYLSFIKDKILDYDLEKYKNDYILEIDKDTKDFEEFNNEINSLKEKIKPIEDKINNFDEPIIFNFSSIKSSFDKLNNCIKNIKEKINKKIQELKDKNDNVDVIIKGKIGLLIESNSFIKNLVNDIDKKNKEIKEIDDKKLKIKDLEDQKSNYQDFINFLNKILSALNINIKLSLDGKDKYKMKTNLDDKDLDITSISEGEKNLFAFLYFYYSLFKDEDQTQIKDEIKLIIIDDPISSLDDFNRMHLFSLIKEIAANERKDLQEFIFTHSYDDFVELSLVRVDGIKINFYEVFKVNGLSSIYSYEHKNLLVAPYNRDFKEIYDFSKKVNPSIEDSRYIPNLMRKVMNKFLEFKMEDGEFKLAKFNEIKELFNIKDKSQVAQLESAINISNIDSHFSMSSIQDISTASQFVMDLIKANDPSHFASIIKEDDSDQSKNNTQVNAS